MQRVIKLGYILDGLNDKKYILNKEYSGFGIYDEVCPNGLRVHQSYLISNGKVNLVCQSYNNLCREELLDLVDTYNACGYFKTKAFMKFVDLDNKGKRQPVYIMHSSGVEV